MKKNQIIKQTKESVADLEYLQEGLFTCFFSNTKAGKEAWLEIAAQTQGTGKIFTLQLPAVLSQLRKAGFRVAKIKKMSEKEKTKILEEIYQEIDLI